MTLNLFARLQGWIDRRPFRLGIAAPLGLALVLGASCTPYDRNAADNSPRHEELQALFDEEWEYRLNEDPLTATAVGDPRGKDRLPDVTQAAYDRRQLADQNFLTRLATLEGELEGEDRINAQIFRRQLEDRVAGHTFSTHQIPILVDSGFHIGFARLPTSTPLRTVLDFEDYISRLEDYPRYTRENIENMRKGLARGFTLAQVVLKGYEVTIDAHIVSDAEQSVFFEPFRKIPRTFPAATRGRIETKGRDAILNSVVPAYAEFLKFISEEYIPGARTSLGAFELPDGEAYYAQRVRHFTTLDLTAQDVHELGLKEVARIRAEMETLLQEVGFAGSFAEFLEFLRRDPQFYAKTAEELLMRASEIAKRMDSKLPSLFGMLPRLPYGVAPVPDHLAPKYTGGRYVPPAEGTTEPGYYWVNTYQLDSRPLYVLPSLTLHEAVPGHHLQGALAREQSAQPNFRRHDYISAYGEGWGLYSEWLGVEAGIYRTPYEHFGRLTYEMWRACRLVVDTGIHAMGWSRQQVLDYLGAHTALSRHEIRTETDRYISWPGQALAYKIGELKIRELRAEAEETLGREFDVRAFHDAILRRGSVTLPILEDEIRGFIRSERR